MPDAAQLLWLFFRFKGRVSRAAFLLAGVLISLVPAFVFYRFSLVPQDSASGGIWAFLFMLSLPLGLWSSVALGAKRFHDIGKPGILAVLLVLPVVSIVAFIALCVLPGEPGPNRYGSRTNAPS